MLRALCDRLHKTSRGLSETELNELAVRPMKAPFSSRVVMMVTPVANCDSALRNARSSAVVWEGVEFVVGLDMAKIHKFLLIMPKKKFPC